ncbi:hypothetical protein GGQ20_001491 [Salinibacter ruber]|nr:hypothetical protein [Salinibacter ruber]
MFDRGVKECTSLCVDVDKGGVGAAIPVLDPCLVSGSARTENGAHSGMCWNTARKLEVWHDLWANFMK